MKRILAVTLNRAWCAELQTAFSSDGSDVNLDAVTTLMEAYSHAEEFEPDLVIVAHSFTKFPEFEMMLMLFSALNIRWLRVTDITGINGSIDGTNRQSGNAGIFNVDVSHPIPMTTQHLKSLISSDQRRSQLRNNRPIASSTTFTDKLILLGASTGGIDALSVILSAFPSNCPPTLIVQHTGQAFGSGLIQSLDKLCSANVVPAKNDLCIKSGMVCIAAGGREHMQIAPTRPFCARMTSGDKVSGHLPSIDLLFESATKYGPSVVAGLLTGMGRDGAEGLLKLRNAGAGTFAQDEASSVVYGMPRVAWDIGAAQTRLPIEQISAHILRACRSNNSVSGLM